MTRPERTIVAPLSRDVHARVDGMRSALATTLRPSASDRSFGAHVVKDPVCRCGHGLSLHVAHAAATQRSCLVCRSRQDAGRATPRRISCESYGA